MKRFYKISDTRFLEMGFVETINKWYADLIDVDTHIIISTNSNTEKTKVIACIVRDNWFNSNFENFKLFINDIL